jgi:hypothetical protein
VQLTTATFVLNTPHANGDIGARSDAFAVVMQQWQKAVVRQQKIFQKTVLSRFIPVEGDPRLHIRGLQAQEFRGLMNQLYVWHGGRVILRIHVCVRGRYAVLVEVLQQCKHVHKLVCGAAEAHASAPNSSQVPDADLQGNAGISSSGAKKIADAAANNSSNVLEKVSCSVMRLLIRRRLTIFRLLKLHMTSAPTFWVCGLKALASCRCCSLRAFSMIASNSSAQPTDWQTSRSVRAHQLVSLAHNYLIAHPPSHHYTLYSARSCQFFVR